MAGRVEPIHLSWACSGAPREPLRLTTLPAVDFSVLGPLHVRVRGETVPVRRGLPRLLLIYLLLHPGDPVAASVLADRM